MVSDRFEPSRRRDALSFDHHREVAPLDAATADALLDQAEKIGWSARTLRAAVNELRRGVPPSSTTCSIADLATLVASGQRFGCILADPPWLFKNQATRGSTSNHYRVMTVDELCALPIAQLAADDAHLHLWVPNALVYDAAPVFSAWGFKYVCNFVWVKERISVGNYWRNAHEPLMTAIRGNATRFGDRSLPSWMELPRGPHSAKPEEVRRMIERASPGPYFELFGRMPVPGWTVWGDQIERDRLFSPAGA